jgi:aminopeptidase N
MLNYKIHRITAVFCILAFCWSLSASDKYPRSTVSDVVHYDFHITLNDTTDRIEGYAVITLAFFGNGDSVSLDLSKKGIDGKGMVVKGVTSESGKIRWNHADDRLNLKFENKPAINDTIKVSVSYHGVPSDGLIISDNKFMDRVFFSDHWPDRAHEYLPCIDHPYDKASVDFIITAPSAYKVVANGLLVSEEPAGTYMRTTRWSERVPLPVKVMAFGAAFFEVESSGHVDGIPVSSWVFFQNRKEGFSDYSIAPKPLRFYIDLIGDYPYRKLANVQSKTIYGGLENAGTIFYSERSVTGRGTAERLIAHEIAHQWFGNHVTEDDWHHVWLSEGFATYLTSMYVEENIGREAFLAEMDSSRSRVIRYYRRDRNPVIDTNVTNLMKLLNPNSYQKGAWVLHMLRNEVGDEIFIKGLRDYYRLFSGSNVLTEDFRKIMEGTSGKDLDGFFRQWLYTGGHPELSILVQAGRKKKTWDIYIEQKQKFLFEFNIDLKVGPELIKVHVNDRITTINCKSRSKPVLVPDPDVRLLWSPVK